MHVNAPGIHVDALDRGISHVPALPEGQLHVFTLVRRNGCEEIRVLAAGDEGVAGLGVHFVLHVEVVAAGMTRELGAPSVHVELLEDKPLRHVRLPHAVGPDTKRRQLNASVDDGLAHALAGEVDAGVLRDEANRTPDPITPGLHEDLYRPALDRARRPQCPRLLHRCGYGIHATRRRNGNVVGRLHSSAAGNRSDRRDHQQPFGDEYSHTPPFCRRCDFPLVKPTCVAAALRRCNMRSSRRLAFSECISFRYHEFFLSS